MTTVKKTQLAKKTPNKADVLAENDKLKARIKFLEKSPSKSAPKSESSDVLAENEKLKAENEALKNAESTTLVEMAEEVRVEEDDVYEDIEISMNKYIRVVSLCNTVLNLSTSRSNPNRKTFRFEHFGQEKRIMYQYLVDIIENHPSFRDSGFFFIVDRDVVRRHGLEDVYMEVLRKEEMERVFTDVPDTAMKIFDTANPRQQKTIGQMIEDKLMAGDDVDMNIVYRVGQSLGIDISARVEDAKSYEGIIR